MAFSSPVHCTATPCVRLVELQSPSHRLTVQSSVAELAQPCDGDFDGDCEEW